MQKLYNGNEKLHNGSYNCNWISYKLYNGNDKCEDASDNFSDGSDINNHGTDNCGIDKETSVVLVIDGAVTIILGAITTNTQRTVILLMLAP